MNTQSVDCKRFEWDELEGHAFWEHGPGAFMISPDGRKVYVILPGFDGPVRLNLRRTGDAETHPSWQWDGNLERPTFSPSILARGVAEWHGYMRSGRLESC